MNVSDSILSIVRADAAERTSKGSSEYKASSVNEGYLDASGLLSSVMDLSEDIVFIIDDSTNIILANQKVSDYLGYDNEEISKLGVLDIAPSIEEEIQVQSKLVGFKKEGPLTIDLYFKSRSGNSFPVEVEIHPIVLVGDYFVFKAKDVLKSNFSHRQPKHDLSDFMKLVEWLPVMVLRYDLKLRCTYANEAFEKITGYPRFKILDKSLDQSLFLTREHSVLMEHNVNLVFDSGFPLEFEILAIQRDNDLPAYLNVIVIPEYNSNGHIIGAVVLAQDITASKLRESELLVALKKMKESNCRKPYLVNELDFRGLDEQNILMSEQKKRKDLAQENSENFICVLVDSIRNLVELEAQISMFLK